RGCLGPHEAQPCFARSSGFRGWSHVRPGRCAHAYAGAETRVVEPHSSSVFSKRSPTIQGSTAPWTRSRSANHAANREAFRSPSAQRETELGKCVQAAGDTRFSDEPADRNLFNELHWRSSDKMVRESRDR